MYLAMDPATKFKMKKKSTKTFSDAYTIERVCVCMMKITFARLTIGTATKKNL